MLERILTYMEEHRLIANANFTTMLLGGGPVPVDYLARAAKLHLPSCSNIWNDRNIITNSNIKE